MSGEVAVAAGSYAYRYAAGSLSFESGPLEDGHVRSKLGDHDHGQDAIDAGDLCQAHVLLAVGISLLSIRSSSLVMCSSSCSRRALGDPPGPACRGTTAARS
jgi:hypothetical protein